MREYSCHGLGYPGYGSMKEIVYFIEPCTCGIVCYILLDKNLKLLNSNCDYPNFSGLLTQIGLTNPCNCNSAVSCTALFLQYSPG